MQSGRAFAPATGVVFDSAFGQRPDDALALALLFGFEGLNEARLLSVSIGSGDLQAAQACDAIAHFYHLPVPGGQGGTGHGGFTIGLLTTGASRANPAMLSAALLKTDADGKPSIREPSKPSTIPPIPCLRCAMR